MANNKVVYIKARFKPVGKYEKVKIPTGEKKKNIMGSLVDVTREEKQWVQTGFSDCEIDGEVLAQETQEAIAKLNVEGYEVVAITDITSGNYSYRYNETANFSYGYGYGYSFTEGVIITARKSQ